ncbi:hypothetical protein LP422_13615 [Janibacter limosus]|uniref:Uncharacterized protein n=1 Tax=Janibacter limosus TaxID=53458 RepID=A0AC61U994_9MICO|nr:hypothetical protein [Janibacter limosus]UUZ46356.1 hypothetical protein LP422_13615 [Janibacter limosus]
MSTTSTRSVTAPRSSCSRTSPRRRVSSPRSTCPVPTRCRSSTTSSRADLLPPADRLLRLQRGPGRRTRATTSRRRPSPSPPTARPWAQGDAVGFVKVVADAEHNEILGAHMIGPDVTELLPVLTLAQKWDLTADEVARNVFAHPTLSEAVKEAVEGIAGHMINL